MAIKALEFEKKWTNPTDFPTYEPDEEQVRADLQYHPNAIAAYINETRKGELEKAVEAIVENDQDISVNMGTTH